ncbi:MULTISPECIES: regulatory protein RecX [Microbacterium]|uniref:Regulatory protein RecX n=1 Tax=Microbacterium plantarum TaxID=1816425 RepID=A0ABV5ERJ7_9MICO|nr:MULTISPECIES: regulatory protein RecX [Microbacterium]
MRSADEAPADDAAVRARAERTLLKRLRGRSLSVREARDVLREAELAEADADAVIAAFLDNGYLDDSRLAEQLLDGALGRKAQGATAIAQTLSRRGLDREVIDIAMASLPDDEAERALEFARQRARGMSGLDHDVALRRLHGQLARRGFRGSVALDAARQALSEQDG